MQCLLWLIMMHWDEYIVFKTWRWVYCLHDIELSILCVMTWVEHWSLGLSLSICLHDLIWYILAIMHVLSCHYYIPIHSMYWRPFGPASFNDADTGVRDHQQALRWRSSFTYPALVSPPYTSEEISYLVMLSLLFYLGSHGLVMDTIWISQVEAS